jgi:hypothetical protein
MVGTFGDRLRAIDSVQPDLDLLITRSQDRYEIPAGSVDHSGFDQVIG